MAHKKKAVKKPPSMQCPTNLKADPKRKGVCYRIERVQRNSHKGYITSFFSRSSARAAGFSSAPGACRKTLDPFQASIRPKAQAKKVGRQCAQASLVKK